MSRRWDRDIVYLVDDWGENTLRSRLNYITLGFDFRDFVCRPLFWTWLNSHSVLGRIMWASPCRLAALVFPRSWHHEPPPPLTFTSPSPPFPPFCICQTLREATPYQNSAFNILFSEFCCLNFCLRKQNWNVLFANFCQKLWSEICFRSMIPLLVPEISPWPFFVTHAGQGIGFSSSWIQQDQNALCASHRYEYVKPKMPNLQNT